MEYYYKRRKTSEVQIGNLLMGGSHPICVQSMTNTSTLDTDSSVEQSIRIIKAGGQLVRLTAQGVREAQNLKNVREKLSLKGYQTPLVADIHFNPQAAEVAALFVEKVRINPGNFVDSIKTFQTIEYTAEEYEQELEKIRTRLLPLLDICKKNKTAIRIGVNHGSLSDRIMSRYGDTPEGMVESCLEFLRICVDQNFKEIVISIKASNTLIMVQTVRLLVKKMEQENMYFPLHLGVTEAGDGEDGRIKSAVGIGTLLAEGLGDTIRVSLSEDPELEIPVAKKLIHYISSFEGHAPIEFDFSEKVNSFIYKRRKTNNVLNIGGENVPVVIALPAKYQLQPDYFISSDKTMVDISGNAYSIYTSNQEQKIRQDNGNLCFLNISYLEMSSSVIALLKERNNLVLLLHTNHQNPILELRAFFHLLLQNNCQTPVIICREYQESDIENLQLKAATDFGSLFLDGFGDGMMLINKKNIPLEQVHSTAFGILQASRVRISRTEYISCPSCGRTLFDLQSVIKQIKAKTSHIKGLKIGIMGCIVNGPGEMADADYGYVGAARGKVSLYKKQECVQKNIDASEAVERLIELIKANGDWIDE